MTGFDDDPELDHFLARRAGLHQRLAERDRIEPPPELDRFVLDKAREAIEVPTSPPLYRSPRWALPMGLAATVVLALAVVLNLGRAERTGYPVAASASPAVNAAPTASMADTQSLLAGAERSIDEEVAAVGSAPAVEMPRVVAATADAKTAADATTPAESMLAKRKILLASGSRANETRVIVPAKREMGLRTTAAEAGTEGPASRPMGTLAQGTASAAAGAAREAGGDPKVDRTVHPIPQAWLREIEQLRAAGRTAEAERELEAFRKAYPDEPIRPLSRDPRPAR